MSSISIIYLSKVLFLILIPSFVKIIMKEEHMIPIRVVIQVFAFSRLSRNRHIVIILPPHPIIHAAASFIGSGIGFITIGRNICEITK